DLNDFADIHKALLERPNEPIPFLYRFLHKNGNYIWIEGVVTNLLSEGSVRAIIANYRDVSERKKWEDEISYSHKKEKANAEQMSAILNALPAAIALLDEKGAIIEVNKNWKDFAAINGFKGGQHGLGDNYLEITRNSIGVDRKEAQRIAYGIEDVLTNKRTRFTTDYACHSPEERRWFKMIVTRLHQNGLGVVVTHLNITEQRQSERQLRLIYEALENSLNAFEIVNQAGEHIYVNRAYLNMYGYNSINEVSGTAPSSRTVDPGLPTKITSLLHQQKQIKMEFTARRKDGTTFEALMTRIMSTDEDGLPIFISSVIDITDRKKYEEKVKEERTLLRTLIDNLPDYIYVKDTQSRHLINNAANLKLMGVKTEAETIGKSAA
ncbi:MAG: hypothetical protein C0490_26975, partial [Marivirga sp.]|nr:hypothetical protein [Marivirga sp.]